MKVLEDIKPVDRNLYLSRHNYYILVSYGNKTLYKIQKEDYNKYKLFKSRYVIALVICVLLYSVVDIKIVIASFFAIGITLEMLYRRFFLKGLDTLENYELPKKISQLDIISADSAEGIRKRVLASFALFVLIAISVVYFLFVAPKQNLSAFEKYGVIVLASAFIAYILYLGIVNIKALKIKEKEFNERKGKK